MVSWATFGEILLDWWIKVLQKKNCCSIGTTVAQREYYRPTITQEHCPQHSFRTSLACNQLYTNWVPCMLMTEEGHFMHFVPLSWCEVFMEYFCLKHSLAPLCTVLAPHGKTWYYRKAGSVLVNLHANWKARCSGDIMSIWLFIFYHCFYHLCFK